jgi:hypothetical protein
MHQLVAEHLPVCRCPDPCQRTCFMSCASRAVFRNH